MLTLKKPTSVPPPAARRTDRCPRRRTQGLGKPVPRRRGSRHPVGIGALQDVSVGGGDGQPPIAVRPGVEVRAVLGNDIDPAQMGGIAGYRERGERVCHTRLLDAPACGDGVERDVIPPQGCLERDSLVALRQYRSNREGEERHHAEDRNELRIENLPRRRGSVSPVARRGPSGRCVDRVSEPPATSATLALAGVERQVEQLACEVRVPTRRPRSPAGPVDRSGSVRCRGRGRCVSGTGRSSLLRRGQPRCAQRPRICRIRAPGAGTGRHPTAEEPEVVRAVPARETDSPGASPVIVIARVAAGAGAGQPSNGGGSSTSLPVIVTPDRLAVGQPETGFGFGSAPRSVPELPTTGQG